MFTKKILAAAITSQPSASGVADAIDFDGATDYLLRSSDLVGNADGKTFTFSAWVWNDGTSFTLYDSLVGGNGGFRCYYTGTDLYIIGNATGGGTILNTYVPSAGLAKDTFNHILVSYDLTNSANRSVYINDIARTVTYTTYINSNIGFSKSLHVIGVQDDFTTAKTKGRLSHVFLAYEYVDLSVEANRRVFITADRKPA